MRTLVLTALIAIPAVVQAADAPGKPSEWLRSRNHELKLTWRRPQASLPHFTQILLPPPEFSYRQVAPLTGTSTSTSNRTDFPVPQRDRDRLAKEFNEVLREELGTRRQYTITDTPGPGVLMVKISVEDIVSRVPPEPAGRGEIYIDTVGDGTLVLRLADSVTGETLAEAADRRTAEPALSVGGFGALRAVSPNVWSEVRRLARRWGMAIGDRLDQLSSVRPNP